MSSSPEFQAFGERDAGGCWYLGQVRIAPTGRGYELRHRADEAVAEAELVRHSNPEDAAEIARFDDAGKYRALKTAPNLRRGWRLVVANAEDLRQACDHIYPGRLAAVLAFRASRLQQTALRETLERQTGMYRAAAKINDAEIEALVGKFCRSDGGCLRTILWKRDAGDATASSLLPSEKFDPAFDQTGDGKRCVPLLCQEACNLLVAEARGVVKNRPESLAAQKPR